MGSRDADAQQAPGDLGCKGAGAGALLVETIRVATLDIAAANSEFCLPILQQGKHLRKLCLIVLQVGIHHGHIGRTRCQNAFNASPGKSTASNSPETADTSILSGETAYNIPGPIGRIIVNEYDFPIDVSQCVLKLFEQLRYVNTLVERGHDDGKLRDVLRSLSERLKVVFGKWNGVLVHGMENM